MVDLVRVLRVWWEGERNELATERWTSDSGGEKKRCPHGVRPARPETKTKLYREFLTLDLPARMVRYSGVGTSNVGA